jgi:aerobic-type carbon monoxide dehydrogenase small subunit (CoxS/CutS family)
MKGIRVTEKSSAYRIQNNTYRGDAFTVSLDGQKITAFPGETLATVLLASGKRMFRHSQTKGEPRGLYCGMGICFECLVTVNGRANVRACQTLAQPDDIVECQS